MGKLNFTYNEAEDVLTVEGVNYSGELFRQLGFGPVESYYQLVDRHNGVLFMRGPLKLETQAVRSGAKGKITRHRAVAKEVGSGTP